MCIVYGLIRLNRIFTWSCWSWNSSSSVLKSSQYSNSWILFFGKSFISSNRISGNDQRIVKVWIIGIIPTFYPESISQTSSHIQFWCNITINVPDKSIRWHSCNPGITFWTSGWSQAGIKGSQRVIQMPMRTPSLDWCGPKRIFLKMNKIVNSKVRNNRLKESKYNWYW